jgi:isopenicillin N synthase-like dioxygenase
MSLNIPVINIPELKAGDPRQLNELKRGLGELGLIHISSHGLPVDEMSQFYDHFKRFCRQPLEDKRRLAAGDIWFQRGWTPPDTERAVLAGGQPDFKECYFAAPLEISDELRAEYPQICAENRWPEGEGEFKRLYLIAGRALHAVGLTLLEGCALAFDLPPDTFTSMIEGGPHVTRALHYLPLQETQVGSDVRWGEEHTDFNLLTLLPGGHFYHEDDSPFSPKEVSGLYLRTRATAEHPQGQRVKGSAPKGCMIAQVGQQLEILTGGRFQATPHEILPPLHAGVHRVSMAHFMHLHPHSVLTPLSAFRTTESVRAYRPPVLAGNYSLKTLVDIGLAPKSSLEALGYRHYGRLEGQRDAEGR